MTCTHCDKPALTVVGKQGYCGAHRSESLAAMAKVSKNSFAKGGRWLPRRQGA